MTFLMFVGGIVVFGLLAIFVPRTSFIVLLGMYLNSYGKMRLFGGNIMTDMECFVTIVLVIGGLFVLLLDIGTLGMYVDKRRTKS